MRWFVRALGVASQAACRTWQAPATQRGAILPNRRWPQALVLVVVAGLAGPAARAQSDADAGVRQEIDDLKRVAAQLNARIEALEHRLAGRSEATPQQAAQHAAGTEAPPPTAPSNGTLPQRWRRLGRGMSMAEVEALLGPPQKTISMSPKTIWYYSYDMGNGSVVFIDGGGVIDWQNPPFATWWW